VGLLEGSLLEYGGLEPILPFLGGRSDAACRVVAPPGRNFHGRAHALLASQMKAIPNGRLRAHTPAGLPVGGGSG